MLIDESEVKLDLARYVHDVQIHVSLHRLVRHAAFQNEVSVARLILAAFINEPQLQLVNNNKYKSKANLREFTIKGRLNKDNKRCVLQFV